MNEVKKPGKWASLTKRTLPFVIAVMILFASVYCAGYVYIAVLLFATVFSMYEIYSAFAGLPDVRPITVPGYVFIGLMVPAWYFFGVTGLLMLFMLCSFVVFAFRIFSKKYSTRDVVFSTFALLYPALLLSMLLLLLKRDLGVFFIPFSERGASMLAMICTYTVAVFTDTFAYLTGMSFGRHRLCPDISPKKTVEGAIGGTLGSMGGMLLIYFFLQKLFGFDFPVYHYIIIGLLASLAAQIGDLAASLIKRFTGIKDFGKLVPGHGGAMDRMDSVIFAAPVVIGYFALVLSMGGIA
ncbi:MAG: phosphatidate cytidylyltransferase [Bacillota bacterium]|nr:phosphatidate cytidylyltransferase [Bacillota bacterium]